MRVHHLNCGTLTPLGAGRLVCHVLLCETDAGLVLVDSGIGTHDIDEPGPRIGPARRLLGFAFDRAETAVAQIEGLGFAASDVRHIVLTHLDFDHVGGIADFPDATVHTTAAEHHAAVVAPLRRERTRYRPAQWSHGPRFETYEGPGEMWQGFGASWPVRGLGDAFALVPLPGHTRGHATVAVDTGDGWLLHAGDAFFHRSSVVRHGATIDRTARTVLAFEALVAADRRAVRGNHERLAELVARGDEGLRVFCSHDPQMFAELGAASSSVAPA